MPISQISAIYFFPILDLLLYKILFHANESDIFLYKVQLMSLFPFSCY